MSLDVLAQNLASKGRNGDSMLVHMTPGEVHGLHALALAHGGRLTINPETGLPEANFLKKLLPMIAGAALNFFLPGVGTAIGSALGGLSGAAGSAIAVGGITGLATGSLQKGLMAGLGAYGGAGLTDALLGGAGAAGAAGALGVEGAASGAGSQAAMLAEQAAGFGGEGLKSLAESAAYAKGATPSLSAAFSAGADAAMKNPGAFLKGAAKPLMYAAAPIVADAMVPTVTPRESKPGDTGYIQQRSIDMSNFGQTPGSFTTLPPLPANRITYPAPPPGGANGGLVAFASGGITLPSDIGTYTADQKADLYNSYLAKGFGDTAIRQAAGTQSDADWSYLQNLAAQRGSPAVSGAERYALTTPGWQSRSGETGIAGINANINQWIGENPAATYAAIQQASQQYGVDTEDIKRALGVGGGSKALEFVTTRDDFRSRSGETGLQGLNANINRWIAENSDATRAQVYDEMAKWQLNAADIKRATGKTIEELFPLRYKTPTGTITGGTTTGTVDTGEALDTYNTTAPTGAPPAVTSAGTMPGYTGTDVTYGGTDVLDKATPATLGTAGKVTRGTETLADVRNAVGNRYKAPTFAYTPSVTGASKSAYDYLMGQGAYPTQQTMPGNAPLWRPYAQGVTGAAPPASQPPLAGPGSAGPPAPSAFFGFKPPSGGTTLTGTQRWRNTVTGEIYLAPNGYEPPSGDWVLDTQSSDTDSAGVGGGGGGDAGVSGGFSSVGVTGAEGASGDSGAAADGGSSAGDGSGVGDGTGGVYAGGGLMQLAMGGAAGGYNLGSYSDGGRLLRGPGDGVSDSIPATIGRGQPARLADGEFVVPARIVSELGNGSTEAGARKLYAMMARVQRARRKTTGKNKVAANTKADRLLPA
jgi:hypothetical protein